MNKKHNIGKQPKKQEKVANQILQAKERHEEVQEFTKEVLPDKSWFTLFR